MTGTHQIKPQVDPADPEIPVGNSPPFPLWPLALSVVGWLAWVVFLAVMAYSRRVTTFL